MTQLITSTRRYYLRKRQNAPREGSSLADFWKGKQEAEPGTALPPDFPLLSTITDLGYTTLEDLRGADEFELRHAGLSTADARTVLLAFSNL